MIVFADINVLLDVLARREEHYEASSAIWTLADSGDITAFISAISYNNIYYILRKFGKRTVALDAMKLIRDVFDSVAPDNKIINQAIDSGCDDFENAIQYHSAIRVGAQYLITRNSEDFPTSPLTIVTPEEFLKLNSDKSVN